jgi:hypothetical protein
MITHNFADRYPFCILIMCVAMSSRLACLCRRTGPCGGEAKDFEAFFKLDRGQVEAMYRCSSRGGMEFMVT